MRFMHQWHLQFDSPFIICFGAVHNPTEVRRTRLIKSRPVTDEMSTAVLSSAIAICRLILLA
ncbi:hypothetical protein DPMN_184472 [Dreissena polymorpha]|uniref:Uncharacterized protein n=1 Tax=Dreissena polymorpha TaxID=45954 RepID=A0A9D4DK43_DREPO|nr:hypothetical protein DPMN_184471 [Dreissena polymorpha]KAH3749956.1 hypothetical protein DPMN_184472 [Dreissena polymorpha]